MRLICKGCSFPILDMRWSYNNEEVRKKFSPILPLYHFCNRAHYLEWWNGTEMQKKRQQRDNQQNHLRIIQGGKEG